MQVAYLRPAALEIFEGKMTMMMIYAKTSFGIDTAEF